MGQFTHTYDSAKEAARDGRALHKWVNDKTPGATVVVLTDVTLYYNIPVGKQVMITQLNFDVATLSDDCHFSLVSCDAVAGGGTPTEISGHAHAFTGNVQAGSFSKERDFNPPIRVRHTDGARSISIRVDANDAALVCSCGWTGWIEPET
jgi:hypothetical protein